MVRIALFHPWLKSRGGGEKVVLEFLKNTKHDVDVYTWIYEQENTFEEFEDFSVKVISRGNSRAFSRTALMRGLYFASSALFSKIDLRSYDVFFISTSGVAELMTLRNYKKGKTLAYVHTILRDSYRDDVRWNLKNKYKSSLKKMIYLIAVGIYRRLEKIGWKKIDFPIFNSELSLSRAKEHGLIRDKETIVISPPVEIKNSKSKTKSKNYFFYLSRFNNKKRQDILIKAWKLFMRDEKNRKYELIFAGDVDNKSYFEGLKKLARGTNIKILTRISEEEKTRLISECKAMIYIPFGEDFGIIPFEVASIGKPLIAMNSGGYVDLIRKKVGFHEVNERFREREMVFEVYRALKEFSSKNTKDKKVSFNELSAKNLAKNIDNFIEEKIN